MHDVNLILLVAVGMAFALLFGAITNRLGLSPIVGYLLAGVMVGPWTPGFVGNAELASELAEIGVILLMFGVGLHFNLSDLLRVKSIAVPGAIVQSAVATILALLIVHVFGEPWRTGLILGLAVSVASTVVLIRVLSDANVLHTPQGHVAVGWLVVEDLFTVVVLVLLPVVKHALEVGDPLAIVWSLVWLAIKIATLLGLVFIVGRRVVPWLMNSMARTRSRELFTLSVLVVALGIAAGSAVVFGVSMALGAFLAGMVVGQSDVSHQAASDALPMRDAFAVLFFISVGMLFDPRQLVAHWDLTLAVLAVVLIGKPLAAYGIVTLLGHPLRTALTSAVALAQIGEFSFILGDSARALGFFRETETSVLVSCAMVSITLNPLLFRLVGPAERWIAARPALARRLGVTVDDPLSKLDDPLPAPEDDNRTHAVVVGYGPVGQTLSRLLHGFDIDVVVIDLNVDTVRRLRSEGHRAIYGDASRPEILQAAGLDAATYLLITLPDPEARALVIDTAREYNPATRILVRAHYLGERKALEATGVTAIAYEEAEVAVALAELLLHEIGVGGADIEIRADAIRSELAVERERTG
jgi:CPA2 family monovalent cation:H+ antiporter-2